MGFLISVALEDIVVGHVAGINSAVAAKFAVAAESPSAPGSALQSACSPAAVAPAPASMHPSGLNTWSPL